MLARAVLIAFVLAISPALAKHNRGGVPPSAPPPAGPSIEEFVGPFPTWACVRSAASGTCGAAAAAFCNATGNGSTDDTTAIQTCLNLWGASGDGGTNVFGLWFPAGTYKITSTLTVAGKENVIMAGADPATTTLLWAGTSGGTLWYINGLAFMKVTRLTFDGNNTAGILIDQNKLDMPSNYFDSGNEYSDVVIKNATIGFRCGANDFGCSEMAQLRNKYTNLTIGFETCNFNSLDIDIWYSTFTNNGTAVTNGFCSPFAGNFHINSSIFSGSTANDITFANLGPMSVENSYSVNSAGRFFSGSNINNSSPAIVIGNTIIDPSQNTPINIGTFGPGIVMGNTIRGLVGAAAPAIQVTTGNPADVFSMGNTVTVGTGTCTTSAPAYSNGHCHEVNDQVVARSSITAVAPTLPGVPPNNARTIYEASPSGSGVTCSAGSPCLITQAIANAVATGNKAVAHVQPGVHAVSSQITVPAGSDIQIIGDGYNSILQWTGGTGTLLQLTGPTKVTLRDLDITGANLGTLVLVTNADQAGSRIYCDQCNPTASTTGVWLDSLDRTLFEAHIFYPGYTPTSGQVGFKITGGAQAQIGNPLGGAANIFQGASVLGNGNSYSFGNGSNVLVDNVFHDIGAGGSGVPMAISGPFGTVTYAGIALNSPVNQTAITVTGFQGIATFAGVGTDGNIAVSGNGSGGNVALIGTYGWCAGFFTDTTSPADTFGFINPRATGKSPCGTPPPGGTDSYELAESGTATTPFFNTVTAQLLNTKPTLIFSDLGPGITDGQIHRVRFENAVTGLHIQH